MENLIRSYTNRIFCLLIVGGSLFAQAEHGATSLLLTDPGEQTVLTLRELLKKLRAMQIIFQASEKCVEQGRSQIFELAATRLQQAYYRKLRQESQNSGNVYQQNLAVIHAEKYRTAIIEYAVESGNLERRVLSTTQLENLGKLDHYLEIITQKDSQMVQLVSELEAQIKLFLTRQRNGKIRSLEFQALGELHRLATTELPGIKAALPHHLLALRLIRRALMALKRSNQFPGYRADPLTAQRMLPGK